MTQTEFDDCLAVAEDTGVDLSGEDLTVFTGLGTGTACTATADEVSALLRWHGYYIAGGSWDVTVVATFEDLMVTQGLVALDIGGGSGGP